MKKTIYSWCVALMCGAGALGLASCGDQLKDYPWMIPDNNTESEDTEGGVVTMDVIEGEMKTCIPFMLNYSHEPTGTWQPHKYQYYRSNAIDNYAGYWTVTKANFAFGPALPTLYTDNNGYLGGASDNQIFHQAKNALEQSSTALYSGADDVVPHPEYRAIALICTGYAAHEMVDFYGAIPYTDWMTWKRTAPLNYEAGAEVYKKVLAGLDEAIATLKQVQPDQTTLQRIEGTSLNKTCTNWEWRYWVKFANSIKLRMALNMADYNDPDPVYGPDSKPFVAQHIAEEAVADPIGVLTAEDDIDIAYRSYDTWTCCLYFMGKSWNDIRLNASYENIMKHFNNPVLAIQFDENGGAIKSDAGIMGPNGIYGVRCGLMMEDTGDATSGGYGPFSVLSSQMEHMQQPFFKRVECIFLRAEGALRGWSMGGEAKDFYEQGIRFAMKEYNVDDSKIDAYLAQDNLPAVKYRDYYHYDNDIDGRVTIGVKWDETGDSKELKLEKIITQKWIANWPMGAEAWTTFRRTGYPRLFPVRFNNMKNVDTELQIRRMSFERTPNNGAEIDQVTELLGGSQDCGTRVFWDVNSRMWGKDAKGMIIPNNNL